MVAILSCLNVSALVQAWTLHCIQHPQFREQLGIEQPSTRPETTQLSAYVCTYPDSKVHGAHLGPIWGRQDPGGPHVGPMNFAISVHTSKSWPFFNSLAPGRFEGKFSWIILAPVLLSLDLTNDKSTSVQVMVWCRQAASHYMRQCWPRLMSSWHYWATMG